MILSESWAVLFREHILAELPVHKLALFFAEDSEKVYENAF